ncbi:MAG: UDP-N-acetylglucosamine--N-acetylmuramyl-(pentapeptide) pyrophosphoryl-undecaprenol N-acetylglucosamine transferase [Candidatus Pacebacteria bacterium]|nr:UDP-N-acetylglucosamine--N-acetylmuramyl-(pentapeptide) pyrophosphoryl-undecaprenol N-acetylglucosamine transferase [Candidatus Paceibacterota bacterium]
MKILFTGGGTGGHVVPIIAITREMRKIYQKKDLQFFYLGPKDEFGQVLLSQEGIRVKTILAGKIRRYSDWKSLLTNFVDVCFKIPMGILQSFFYLFFISPDLIFSKGGFGSIPGAIAGRILFVPMFLHESDIAPGKANQFLSGFALEIFVSFPRTEYFPLRKMILVGNPVRRELLQGSKQEARTFFKLTSNKPVILILGGSQGAQRINDKILEILPQLVENFEIIHQCGDNNFESVKAESKVVINENLEKSYHLYPFLKEPELRQAYAACDIIVSRAGSGSIFEIAAAGKPSILIPLPESAQNHQVKNAYAYQESESTIVIEENNFTSRFFLERLKSLFSRPDELNKMAQAAKEFARPGAGRIIANYIVEYLSK